jgi:Ribosomal protein S6
MLQTMGSSRLPTAFVVCMESSTRCAPPDPGIGVPLPLRTGICRVPQLCLFDSMCHFLRAVECAVPCAPAIRCCDSCCCCSPQAHIWQLDFAVTPETLAELKTQMRINEDVLRWVVVKRHLPKPPGSRELFHELSPHAAALRPRRPGDSAVTSMEAAPLP